MMVLLLLGAACHSPTPKPALEVCPHWRTTTLTAEGVHEGPITPVTGPDALVVHRSDNHAPGCPWFD